MGFEIPRRTASLTFDQYPGLEVTAVLDVPLQMYFELARLANSEDVAQVEAALRRFGDEVLMSWNAEEKSEPLPADAEGLMRLGMEMAKDILEGWMKGMVQLPAPLAAPSPNGGITEPSPATSPQS